MDRNLAYATVLGLADSADSFKKVVGEAADRMGFDLLELEEEEPLRIRQLRCEVPSAALRLASQASDPREVRFSPLHTWIAE